MKTSNKLLCTLTLCVASTGFAKGPHNKQTALPKPANVVSWVGEIKDTSLSHTTRHFHELEFTNKETGKSYDIVDSPELKKLHCESGKNFLVKIEAERTPRVLFWGNNLIVKSFTVLGETSEVVAHKTPVERVRISRF